MKTVIDKELDMDIDWSKAPEGAAHLSMGSESFPAYYYKLASDGLMLSNEYTNGWVHSCNANSWLINNDSLITKPQPTPTYTQEDADNGVQVESGMRFATETGEYIAEYTNKKSVCFTDENGFLVTVTRGHAKPIDTRTDKEKAIDKYIAKQVSLLTCNEAGMIRDAFEAGATFHQLTVENK